MEFLFFNLDNVFWFKDLFLKIGLQTDNLFFFSVIPMDLMCFVWKCIHIKLFLKFSLQVTSVPDNVQIKQNGETKASCV